MRTITENTNRDFSADCVMVKNRQISLDGVITVTSYLARMNLMLWFLLAVIG